jgi:hypothetical protein
MACEVAVGDKGVAVDSTGVGAGLVPNKELQAERPNKSTKVKEIKVLRKWKNILQIIPIKKL